MGAYYLDATPCGTEIVSFGRCVDAMMNQVDGMTLFDGLTSDPDEKL